ncbi:MAG: efflux RND transporter periplasmic adaptor subunit [Cypionkella sp.]
MTTSSRRALLPASAILLFGLWGTVAPAQQQGGGAIPVTVVTVQAQDVTLTSTLPGRVVASGVAEVRPQVGGIIKERLFDEGAEVTEGEPLYRIEAATYEALVAAANAAVAQAQATLSADVKEAARYDELVGRSVVSQQAVDASIATRDAAAAALQVAQAQLLSANIDLDRTTIKAPLSGVVGRSLTTQGSLVTAGQADALAVIRKLDPVYVDVTQSAAELIKWRRGATGTALMGADQSVTLTLADGEVYEHKGHLSAAEPYVNESTGVVLLRMEFPNPDHFLLPGMYVQAEMPQGILRGAILAPQEGVSRDTRGQPIAYVVNADNKIEVRQLTINTNRGADWIVTDGLKSGDRIVVEGVQKISDNAVVAPQERAAAAAQPAASTDTPTAPSGN